MRNLSNRFRNWDSIGIGLLIVFFVSSNISLFAETIDATSPKERAKFANSIRAHVEKLLSYLPKQRPSEVSWIKGEWAEAEKLRAAGKIDAWMTRKLRLIESPEFSHEQLYSSLTSLKTTLLNIPKLQTAKNDKGKLKKEMLLWAFVNYTLSESVFWDPTIENLTEHGRLPKDIIKKVFDLKSDVPGMTEKYESIGFSDMFNWTARDITRDITIPYLSDKISK